MRALDATRLSNIFRNQPRLGRRRLLSGAAALGATSATLGLVYKASVGDADAAAIVDHLAKTEGL